MSYQRPAELFASTAKYYARFRVGYPERFVEHVVGRYRLTGDRGGRLLDLGCGTGQLTLPLARFFEEAVGIDPSPEMLAEAKSAAAAKRITNVRWIVAGSDDLDGLRDQIGPVRLATMGSSFHWMAQDKTLLDLFGMVQPGGGIVISSSTFGLWSGSMPWQQVVQAVIQRWLGELRRAGIGTYQEPSERFETIIARSPFAQMETYHLPRTRTLEVEQIIGLLYSTSFCSPAILGERRIGFEHDLRASLLELDPRGRFTEDVTIDAYLARKV